MCDCFTNGLVTLKQLYRWNQTLIEDMKLHPGYDYYFFCQFCRDRRGRASGTLEYPAARGCPSCHKDICWDCDKERATDLVSCCDCGHEDDPLVKQYRCEHCQHVYCSLCEIEWGVEDDEEKIHCPRCKEALEALRTSGFHTDSEDDEETKGGAVDDTVDENVENGDALGGPLV